MLEPVFVVAVISILLLSFVWFEDENIFFKKVYFSVCVIILCEFFVGNLEAEISLVNEKEGRGNVSGIILFVC